MSVIGIDQSLTGTGLVEIDNDGNLKRMTLVKTGTMRDVQRLRYITSNIIEFCKITQERFVVAREGYSFGSKGRATFSLGELGGCVDLKLFETKIPHLVGYYILPPTVVRKFALGLGNIKKDSGYLLKVYNKFKIEFPDDNQADAFMIAKTLLGIMKSISVKSGSCHETFVKGLTLIEKESLVSSLLSTKGSGVTKSTIKTMNHNDFATKVSEALKGYLCFEKESK